MGWATDESGFDFRQCKNLFFTAFRPALALVHPPIARLPGAHSPGAERPGRKADNSPTSNAETKNRGAMPPLHDHGVVFN
jgi:hypothetical protein